MTHSRKNLDVENVKKGSVEPRVARLPRLGLPEVDDLANSVHWRVVHLRVDSVHGFVQNSTLLYPISLSSEFCDR